MLTTKQKILQLGCICCVAFLLGLFFATFHADAAIIYSQVDDSVEFTSATTTWSQVLGTGLSGTINYVVVQERKGTSTQYDEVRLHCWTDSSKTTGCGPSGTNVVAREFPVTDNASYTSKTQVLHPVYPYNDFTGVWTIPGNYSFDPTKYYELGLGFSSPQYLYGSATEKYAGGNCNSTDCRGIIDLYFQILSNSNLSTTEGIKTITSPTYAQVVTSQNNVNFSFTYYSTSLYTRAGFDLVDNTTGQSINANSASSSISSSGSGAYSQYFDLTYGHNYTWTPWIKGNGLATLYGTPTFFFVGTNQSLLPTTPQSNPYATSTYNSGYFATTTGASATSSGLITLATTSIGALTRGILTDDLDNLLRRKFPFSYIYDGQTLILELANGTSTGSRDAEYTLPYGKTTSTGSTSIKIIDTSAIAALPIVQQIKTLIGYSIRIVTALGIIGTVASIL